MLDATFRLPCCLARMIKAIIFDVDGTLIDSVDAHAKAWQQAFAAFGYAFPFETLRGQIGKGGDQLLPFMLSQEEADANGKAIDARRASIVKTEYLPGIAGFAKTRELFEALHVRGIKIALASSAKGEELGVYKRKADIEGLVEEQTSSDDAERSKPHGDIFQSALDRLSGLEPTQALVVGDTPYDAEAAKKVGLRTIGVLCGGFLEHDLRRAGCIAIYKDPADLLTQIDRVVAGEAN